MMETVVDKGVDEGLYSRQIAVFGKVAMEGMASANILIINCNALGVKVGNSTVLLKYKLLLTTNRRS